jgi:NADP-dependent 3-hydroxy acid dehydrogenase YdfG
MVHFKASRVILAARRLDELERVRSECKAGCDQIVDIVKLDVSDPDECLAFAQEFSSKNRIDILVNNAGVSQRD